jgi:hypothetical protein
MNIAQMHISVQHGVDKINSMHSDLLLPEEIDLELNKNIMRFINQRFNSRGNRYQAGFEQSQKRVDDLRSLITEASLTVQYKGNVFDGIHVEAADFPLDYLRLVNVKSLIHHNKCKKVDWILDDFFIGQSVGGVLVTLIGLDPILYTTYMNARLRAVYPDGTSWVDITTGTPPANATYNQFKTFILNPNNWASIVESITAHPLIPTAFDIVMAPGVEVSAFQLIAYSNTSPSNPAVATTAPVTSTPADFLPQRAIETDDFVSTVGMNRFAQHDDIFKLLQDPFNKTKYKEPIYTIKDDTIEVYSDESFIVNKIKITYLKQPVIVDFNNNIDCGLPVHTHQELVDMTINSILEAFSDPRYQSTNMEVLKSE